MINYFKDKQTSAPERYRDSSDRVGHGHGMDRNSLHYLGLDFGVDSQAEEEQNPPVDDEFGLERRMGHVVLVIFLSMLASMAFAFLFVSHP
jgi:hypothetical protein